MGIEALKARASGEAANDATDAADGSQESEDGEDGDQEPPTGSSTFHTGGV